MTTKMKTKMPAVHYRFNSASVINSCLHIYYSSRRRCNNSQLIFLYSNHYNEPFRWSIFQAQLLMTYNP